MTYSKWAVVLASVLFFSLVMADHFSSETFAYNAGKGGDTILLRLDDVSGGGCGAPS